MSWQGDRPGMARAQKHCLEIFADGCGTSQKSKGGALDQFLLGGDNIE